MYLYLIGCRKDDRVRLKKHFICAEADYLSQKLMKCESDDATYSLQSLQITKCIKEIKVSITLKILKKPLVFQRQEIL